MLNDNVDEAISPSKPTPLTAAQEARIEKNRQKAIQLRNAKLIAHPYAKTDSAATVDKSVIKVHGTKFIDSGGGFLIEETEAAAAQNPIKNVIPEPAVAIPVTYQECMECNDNFAHSYLLTTFDYPVCDDCRDNEDKHSLITRTEAKNEYLLKDCDLDKREPILKFISRKNPHNVRWGDMKLYLHVQVEKRALEVWESEEKLLAEKEMRGFKKEKTKVKKYNKQLKALRMNVRSSLYDRTTAASHTHAFGPETYNEDEDTYTHSCLTCEYVETFEKM